MGAVAGYSCLFRRAITQRGFTMTDSTIERLSADDILELRYMAKKGGVYAHAKLGSDYQLDKLSALGLIKFLGHTWIITEKGRDVIKDQKP